MNVILDTNILVRYTIGDEAAQTARPAARVMQ